MDGSWLRGLRVGVLDRWEQDIRDQSSDGVITVRVNAVGSGMVANARDKLGARDNTAEEAAVPKGRAIVESAATIVVNMRIMPVHPQKQGLIIPHVVSLADA